MFAFVHLGHRRTGCCSAPATRSASSRCSWRPGPDGIAFASEKKSLLDLGRPLGIDRDIDAARLQHYLVLQYVPEPETLHRGDPPDRVGLLCTVIRPGGARGRPRYFAPRFAAPVPFRRGGEQARYDEITAVLEDSVAKHMRADVTVGRVPVRRHRLDRHRRAGQAAQPELITFTTGFEREGFSEVDVAAESAEAIGVRHVAKMVSQDELVAALPVIVWYLDDPVADPALVPLYFVAREARKHVKVVLSGEGADELFGGYTIYREPLSLQAVRLPAAAACAGRWAGRRAPLPEGMRGKSLLRRGSLTLEERYYGNARIFREDAAARGAARLTTRTGRTPTSPRRSTPSRPGWDPVARMQHVDLFTWLRGDILVKADKMTMANSLELRVPFLDPEVFEVASPAAARPEDHQDHHQVRAAPGAGADRARRTC